MSEKRKKGEQVRRCLTIIEALAQHVADGMMNKEIAHAVRTSAVNASRDMELLESLGWARRGEDGRWYLSNKPQALLKACEQALNDMIARTEEARANLEAAAQRYRR